MYRRRAPFAVACTHYAMRAAQMASVALVMALLAHPAAAQNAATPVPHTPTMHTIDIVGTGSSTSPGASGSSAGAAAPSPSARATGVNTAASAPVAPAASGSHANTAAQGADVRLRIIVPTAYAYAVHDIANTFTAHTGMHVVVHVTTAGNAAGSLRERGTDTSARAQPFDIVIATQADIGQMTGQGLLAAQTNTPLPKVGIGLAVPAGRAIPNIATVDALRRTLLSAHTVVFEDPALGGPSGANVVKLFDRLGVADRMKSRSKMVPAEDIRHALTHSHADLVIEESRLLRDAPGVQYVGPLPTSVQYFTRYAGAVTERSTHPTAARALLSFIAAGLSPQLQIDP
jgi:molybdate transport system substrate-binding protein